MNRSEAEERERRRGPVREESSTRREVVREPTGLAAGGKKAPKVRGNEMNVNLFSGLAGQEMEDLWGGQSIPWSRCKCHASIS